MSLPPTDVLSDGKILVFVVSSKMYLISSVRVILSPATCHMAGYGTEYSGRAFVCLENNKAFVCLTTKMEDYANWMFA